MESHKRSTTIVNVSIIRIVEKTQTAKREQSSFVDRANRLLGAANLFYKCWWFLEALSHHLPQLHHLHQMIT
ncbi:hypothetical protein PQR46_08255 [Paraburkholderia sediminicola]|uniref:hypothetical protein n=1 Tax=Paraburkholderia TaxID=1822464 RepID=UPI0038BDCF43